METEEKNQIESQYADLVQDLEKGIFTSLENNLESNREETLGVLLLATEEGSFKLRTETGRKVWKKVVDYLYENRFTEDLSDVEATLSQINYPIKRKLYVSLNSFLGGVCTAASFAGVNGYRVARRLVNKNDHHNIIRLLHSQIK